MGRFWSCAPSSCTTWSGGKAAGRESSFVLGKSEFDVTPAIENTENGNSVGVDLEGNQHSALKSNHTQSGTQIVAPRSSLRQAPEADTKLLDALI